MKLIKESIQRKTRFGELEYITPEEAVAHIFDEGGKITILGHNHYLGADWYINKKGDLVSYNFETMESDHKKDKDNVLEFFKDIKKKGFSFVKSDDIKNTKPLHINNTYIEECLTESSKTLEDKVYDDLDNKGLIPYASTRYNGYRIEAMNDKDIAKAKMVAKKYNLETKERKFKDYTEVTMIIPTKEELKQKELEQKKEEENKAKEIKESMRLKRAKKLNETWKGDDIIADLVARAQGYIDDGVDVEESIESAIDDGLIYISDIIDLADHYGVIDNGELIGKFYGDLYTDIADRVEEKDEDEDENGINESIKNKKRKKAVMGCLKEARINKANRLGNKKKNLHERLITVKIDSDDVVEQLMNRLDYWTKDYIAHELYEQMYENYAEDGLFDDIEFDVMKIVDNDWVNNCDIVAKGDEGYDKLLELYNEDGFGDISTETDYSYIEAAKEDKNGDLAFLVRW